MTDIEESIEVPIEASEDDPHVNDENQDAEEEYKQFEAEYQQTEDIAVNNDESEEQMVKRLRREDIRKPYSKWVLFCIETRPKIVQETPGATFKEIANTLAAQFKAISSEENERLEAAVASDKIRYSKEIENALPSEDVGDTIELHFPLAKIKKIAKMDPDVKNIGKESLVALTKAAELFVGHLALKCSSQVALRGARSITESDVINVIHAAESMDFLRLDFPKLSVSEKNKKLAKKVATTAVSDGKGILEMMGSTATRAKEGEVAAVSEEVSQLTPL